MRLLLIFVCFMMCFVTNAQSRIRTEVSDPKYNIDYRKLKRDFSSLDEDFYQSEFFEDRFKCYVYYQGKTEKGVVLIVLTPVDHPDFDIAVELPVVEKLYQEGVLWTEIELAYMDMLN